MQSRIVFLKSLSGLLAGPRGEHTIADTLLGTEVLSLESVGSTPTGHIDILVVP